MANESTYMSYLIGVKLSLRGQVALHMHAAFVFGMKSE